MYSTRRGLVWSAPFVTIEELLTRWLSAERGWKPCFEAAFDGFRFPISATVVGEDVQVISVGRGDGQRELVATCERARQRYDVAVLDVDLRDAWIAHRPIIPYAAEVARTWARLSAGTNGGRPRPQNDTWTRGAASTGETPPS